MVSSARVERRLRRHKFEHVNALQRPAMPLGDQPQLLLGLRECDVEDALALADPFQQELQRKRGLAGARTPLVEVHPIGIEATVEDTVELRAPR